ncbi:MAG: CHASE3 domain-containing protein [Acidobacteriota bacterium]|nr:CHASE3 domain-containing protein [Acidobacteriota bacterium]
MKLALEKQIYLAFIIALLLLLTLGFLGYRSANSLNEALKWEKHTQEVFLRLDDALTLAIDAETGGRGFVITGNESFLKPYQNASLKFRENFARLRTLIANNPSQTEKLAKLERLVDEKFNFINRSIEIRRKQGLNATIEQTNSGEGKALMDEIRLLTGTMKSEEENLLKKRDEDLNESISDTLFILFFGTSAGILSLGLANIAIFREFGKRRAAEDKLRDANADLGKRVDERTRELSKTNADLIVEVEKREESEETLRESEIFTRTILDSLSAHIAVLDENGKIVATNEAWENFGKENCTEEIQIYSTGIGQNYLQVCERSAAFEENTKAVLENLQAVLDGEEKKFHFEYACHSLSKECWFILQVNALQGAKRGAVVSHINITDRKFAEREREELLMREQIARKDAEVANRLRDEFLATVSHELRAPLNSILGWARLLQKGQLDQSTSEKAIATIVRNSEAQNHLIEDLLDVSRIISGKLRLEVMTIKPINVLESALETARPAAEAKGIKLEIKQDADVSHISGDPNRLQQVVWNLLSNAIKFTPPEGEVRLEIERAESFAEIRVRDTGVGIKEEFLPHVFDRFRQADASSIRKFGGLGLGLAIVRHITEMHGGTVHAESAGENKGSTFIVRLPLIIQSSEENDAMELRNKVGRLKTESELSLSGMLILVVDDEEDTRQLLVQSLTFYGATVIMANSAEQAFTELQDKNPDVLVSDIGMPNEDGYSLIRRVRLLADPQHRNVPAIALTAFTRAQDRMRALTSGYQNHVAKPVEPDELATVIASLTGRLQKNEPKSN